MSIQDKINFHDTRSVDAIHYNIPIQDIKLDQDKRVDTVRSVEQDRSVDFYNQNRSIDTVRSADQNRSVDFYNQNRSVDTVISADQNRSIDIVRSVEQDIIKFQEPQALEIRPATGRPNPEIVIAPEIIISPGIATSVHNFKTREYPSIYSIFHSILAFFAIYLSFKCNGGFSFGGFFMAIFFPYIYIIYKYATSEKFCGIFK